MMAEQGAIDTLVSLRRVMGPALSSQLANLKIKPALLATIEDRFASIVDIDTPSWCSEKRVVLTPAAEAQESESGSASNGPSGIKLVNLSSAVATACRKMDDSNWKERMAALEALDAVLRHACRGAVHAPDKGLAEQEPYMEAQCGPLWSALKARLKDSNKNVVVQALAVLSRCIAATGSGINNTQSTQIKSILPMVMGLIGDSKRAVRDAVIGCLEVCAGTVNSDLVLKSLPAAITVESPPARQEALRWCCNYLKSLQQAALPRLDVSPLLQPMLDSLLHRTSEVRTEAEACLVEIVKLGSWDQVSGLLRDLKPAQVQTLRPLYDKAALLAAKSLLGAEQAQVAGKTADVHTDVDAVLVDTPLPPLISQKDEAVDVGASATHVNPMHAASRPTSTPTPAPPAGHSQEGMPEGSPVGQGIDTTRRSIDLTTPAPPAARSVERRLNLTPASCRRSTGLMPLLAASSHGPSVGASRCASSPSRREDMRSSCPSVIPASSGMTEALDWLLKRNKGKDFKDVRLRKYLAAVGAKAKVVGEDAREIEGMLASLRDSLEPVTHPRLLSALFSKDVKRQVDGLRLLSDACQGVAKEDAQQEVSDLLEGDAVDAVVDNSDLVLRLCSLRIAAAQRSPLVILGVLALLSALLQVLAARCPNQGAACQGGVLSEQEAVIWVSCVVEEMGSNNEAVRNEARRIIKGLPGVYPPGSLLSLLLDRAAQTRNNKARSECILEAAALIQQY